MWGVEQNEPKILAPFPHSISTADYAEITTQIKNGIPFEWTCEACVIQGDVPLHESTRLEVKLRNAEPRYSYNLLRSKIFLDKRCKSLYLFGLCCDL